MRALAAALVLGLAVAPPADAKLRAKVHHKVKRKASKRWKHLAFMLAQAPAASAPAAPSQQAPAATPVPTATPVATPKPPSLPAPSGTSVSVRSTEWAFTLSSQTVKAGSVKVQFDNSAAMDPHDLEVDDPGGHEVITFGRQPAGTVTSRTVTLGPGDHLLLCPIPTHSDLGMRATLHVSG
jgi:plastocyanin